MGSVKRLKGTVTITRASKAIPAKVGTNLYQNDTIATGDNAAFGMIMTDNSVLSMGPNSRLTIRKYVFDPAKQKASFVARMFKGTVVYLSGLIVKLNRKGVRIETRTAVMGIRGTRVAIKVRE